MVDINRFMAELFALWVEPNRERRRLAIESHFHPKARFFDHDGEFEGYDELATFSDSLQNRFPGARFELVAPPVLLGDAVRGFWRFGTEKGGVTGMDFIVFEGDKIRTLYAFVDLPT